MEMKAGLLKIFHYALAMVEGRRLVRAALPNTSWSGPVRLVAIGKAAVSMAAGARDVLGDQIEDALVITKYDHDVIELPSQVIESGHPRPDAQSLAAGRRLLQFIEMAPDESNWLFLLSGGASSLVEVLPDGIGLEQLREANRWLLGSGLAIGQMNRIRKGLSLIKGGRLAQRLAGRKVLNLLLSDVPGDDPSTIGSGLLVADPDATPLDVAVPDWLRAMMGQVPAAPVANDPCFDSITTVLLAGNQNALEAAAQQARELGLVVTLHPEPLTGTVEQAAQRIMTAVEDTAGLHIWGGETTVVLPAAPGRGGRNQHLALLLAQWIQGQAISILCAGTDGSDGETGDAGALVDGGTAGRGDLHYEGGIDWALSAFDSGTYLEGCGDLIRTGPTGTNVMDIVLAYRHG